MLGGARSEAEQRQIRLAQLLLPRACSPRSPSTSSMRLAAASRSWPSSAGLGCVSWAALGGLRSARQRDSAYPPGRVGPAPPPARLATASSGRGMPAALRLLSLLLLLELQQQLLLLPAGTPSSCCSSSSLRRRQTSSLCCWRRRGPRALPNSRLSAARPAASPSTPSSIAEPCRPRERPTASRAGRRSAARAASAKQTCQALMELLRCQDMTIIALAARQRAAPARADAAPPRLAAAAARALAGCVRGGSASFCQRAPRRDRAPRASARARRCPAAACCSADSFAVCLAGWRLGGREVIGLGRARRVSERIERLEGQLARAALLRRGLLRRRTCSLSVWVVGWLGGSSTSHRSCGA